MLNPKSTRQTALEEIETVIEYKNEENRYLFYDI